MCALLLAGSLALLVVAAFAAPAAGSGGQAGFMPRDADPDGVTLDRAGLDDAGLSAGRGDPGHRGAGWSGTGAPDAASDYAGVAPVAVVLPGDTLWSVAARHLPSRDAHGMIEQIRRLNGLEGHTIHPGQELLLPGWR